MTAQVLQFRVDRATYPFLLSVLEMERNGVLLERRGDIYYQSRSPRGDDSRRLYLMLDTPYVIVSKELHPVTVVRLEDGVMIQVLDYNPINLWWDSELGEKPKKVLAHCHSITPAKLKIGKRYKTEKDDPANFILTLPVNRIYLRFEDFWEAKVTRT